MAAPNDERRVVTVLFADLVGFTKMSETLDPEQVKNFVDRIFERLAIDITAFGGRVDKIIGDAIVALFGAPIAHEDDAERAVRAALRMQRTVATLAAEVGEGVWMRIGVNTGEVLVGALRAGGDYTAMGDVVNSASRLQGAAEPGSVLVGPATHAATRELIGYEPVGLLDVKGRTEPVDTHRAIEELAPPGYRRRRIAGAIVGRDAELGMLGHAVEAAVSHHRGHLLLVMGEAGLGKTRLATEVAELARCNHDAVVFEGRCVPYGEANVWWPIAEAIRGAVGIDGSDSPERARGLAQRAVGIAIESEPDDPEVERIVTGLLHLMGYESLAGIDPQRAREEASRSVQALLEVYARRRPVVVVLSDLHWADDLVLEMVDGLLERLARLPFVLVGTARHSLEERWSPRPGRHNLAVLNLDPLDRAASAALLTTLLGEEPPADLQDLLLERSGGNPFFLEELVALLDETGSVGADAGSAAQDLPDTLRGLVAARLDALDGVERYTLDNAAVLGKSGPVVALQLMAKDMGTDDDAAVEQAVAGLVAKEVLVVEDGQWNFRSDLVREVAYSTLTRVDRAKRHAGIARWLEKHQREDDSDLYRIAHHYSMAATSAVGLGQIDDVPDDVAMRAIDWLERAAEQAEASELHVTAERLSDQGLALLGDLDAAPARRLGFLLARARGRAHRRDLDAARVDIESALVLAEKIGDRAGEAAAVVALGDTQQKAGDFDGAKETLTRAAALFRELEDGHGLAEALRLRGMTDVFRGAYDEAEETIEDALERYVEIGDRRGQAWALQNLAWIAYVGGRTDEAENRLRESADTFTEIGDQGGLGWALGLLGFVRFHQGDLGEAERLAERILPEAIQRGDRWAEGMMRVLTGSVRLWAGRTAEALPAARAAVEVFDAINDEWGLVQAESTLGRVLVSLGEVEEAFVVLLRAAERAKQGDGANESVFGTVVVAAASVQIGAPERARPFLDDSILDLIDPALIGSADVLVARALADLQEGRVDAAADDLASLVAGPETALDQPNAASALALIRAAQGRVDEAEALAQTVCDAPRGTYLDRAYAIMASALALVRHGDPEAAEERFERARVEVDRTGDRVAQAVVRLAEAHGLAALDSRAAPEAMRAADTRLSELGIDAAGWATAFRVAAIGDVVLPPAG